MAFPFFVENSLISMLKFEGQPNQPKHKLFSFAGFIVYILIIERFSRTDKRYEGTTPCTLFSWLFVCLFDFNTLSPEMFT